MIGHKRVPSRSGGVEVVVGELATRLVALGHEVTVFNRRDASAREARGGAAGSASFSWRGVHVRSTPTIDARGFAALSASFTATLSAIRMRPDVIHYHAEGPCVPLVLARLAGIRTVATIHGLDWKRAKWGRLASAYIRLGERIAARWADELIVLAPSTERYFMDAYGRRAHVIPNGAPTMRRRVPRTIGERWGLERGSYVLYLSRIVPEKGLHYLVEAFRGIETDGRLVVAGSALDSLDYAEEIKRLSSGDERIVMTGFVDGELLEELYSNAYAYVLPSDVEGMPLSLLEAMSLGLPCVTSDIPECAGVLGGCGATFPRGDVAALRSVLQGLLDDPARAAELGRRAAERAARSFGWDAVVDRTVAVYEGVHS